LADVVASTSGGTAASGNFVITLTTGATIAQVQTVLEAIRYAERKHVIWEGVQGRVMLAIVDQSQGAIEESRSSLREALRLAVDHGYGTYADQIQRALVSLQSGEPISLIA
jgi:hypothetical protein